MVATASPTRLLVLKQLAHLIFTMPCSHPLRVAIDGVDAAGKTHLASELASVIQSSGRPVIRASEDGFHRPRAERYRRGSLSPQGYYLDSFNTPAILASLLLPLGPGGDRRYRCAVFDHRSDTPVRESWQIAPDNAVLLFDGIFLLRPELNPHWDYRIFVRVNFSTSVERGCQRDLSSTEPGAMEALHQRYWRRYVAGQKIYLRAVKPESLADMILVNDNLDQPSLIQPLPKK